MKTSSKQSPKHVRVREILRERILKGQYPPGCRLPPECELPKQMRVSSTTIVRAMNDLVREGLIVRRRRSGSYVADPTKRPIIPGRHLRIGLLLNHSIAPEYHYTSSFHRHVIDGLLQGWAVDVPLKVRATPEEQPTSGMWDAALRGIAIEAVGEEMNTRRMHPRLETVRAGDFDGMVALGIIEDHFISGLLDLKLPLVLVDFNSDRFSLHADQVYFDPLPGYRTAIAQLAAQGARRIHFVGGLMRKPAETYEAFLAGGEGRFDPKLARIDPDSLLRLSAFRQAMAELGLSAPENRVHYAWPDKKHLRSKAEELAQLPPEERPEAVVCHSADQAQGFVEIFAELGLRLAGTGATSEGYLGSALPVFASGQAMGRTAASLLVWKLQQPDRVPLRVGVPMRCGDEKLG